MNLERKLEILECYILMNKSPIGTLREFKKRHNLIKDSVGTSTIIKLVNKFQKTENLNSDSSSGRPSLVNQRVDAVKEVVATSPPEINPMTSVRKISSATRIPIDSVDKTLRRHFKLWSYKISLVQGLQAGDTEKRLEFCEWFNKNEYSLPDILWSDECYFSLSGTLNTHNCRIWSNHNLHCIKETQLH